MKSISFPGSVLILSFLLTGQASAFSRHTAVDDIHQLLQVKIDKVLLQTFTGNLDTDDEGQRSKPDKKNDKRLKQPRQFPFPDCLCHLNARVM